MDGKKAYDATEKALNDAANWTAGAFTDAYDWMKEGDNWEALGKTVVGSTMIGFSGDWEKGWELFTNSDMYYGDTYDKIENAQKQKKAYEKAMKKQAEQCAKFDPKVGQPIKKGGRYTYTDNFNMQLMMNGVPPKAIYGAFGNIKDPNHKMMNLADCADKDCLNPCYGQNQYGACYKCTMYMLKHEGARHSVCDLCVV